MTQEVLAGELQRRLHTIGATFSTTETKAFAVAIWAWVKDDPSPDLSAWAGAIVASPNWPVATSPGQRIQRRLNNDEFAAYYQSAWWKTVSLTARKLAGFRCQRFSGEMQPLRCDTTDRLQTHHVTDRCEKEVTLLAV